jgi:hypothetical protein
MEVNDMKLNYVELLDMMVRDVEAIVEEVENDFTIGEYIASLEEDFATEINENNDITMAVIKMATDKYVQVISENNHVNATTYAIRRSMREMAELIEKNLSIRELVMESYGCGNFGDEVMDCLDGEDYEGVISFMLIEEIINA